MVCGEITPTIDSVSCGSQPVADPAHTVGPRHQCPAAACHPRAQQLGPGLCGLGLAGMRSNSSIIRRVFDLPNAVGEGAGHQPSCRAAAAKLPASAITCSMVRLSGCEDVASVRDGQLIFVQAF